MNFPRLLATTCATAIAVGAAAPAFAGDIVGNVNDATGTIALQSAQVRVVELDRVVTTARDGAFTIAGVPAGDYTLEVRYVGAANVTQAVSVPETGIVRATIALGTDSE
ncbi:MAG: DUF2012 domain-containing protein, partial [Alphaproteobacteria bacterium]